MRAVAIAFGALVLTTAAGTAALADSGSNIRPWKSVRDSGSNIRPWKTADMVRDSGSNIRPWKSVRDSGSNIRPW